MIVCNGIRYIEKRIWERIDRRGTPWSMVIQGRGAISIFIE